ncbi:MAG: energy transducer TonB [bacterium]|nr:energy transducer TonB [bacterium]
MSITNCVSRRYSRARRGNQARLKPCRIVVLGIAATLFLAASEPLGDDAKVPLRLFVHETDYEGPPPLDAAVEVDLPPEALKEAAPKYPSAEAAAGVEGEVWMKVLVSQGGGVYGAVVHRSSGFSRLDEAAVKAAVRNLYKPAIKDMRPIAVWVDYKVSFKLPRIEAKD